MENAGGNSSLVVDRVLNGADVPYGYDALRDEYVDMFKSGERAGLAGYKGRGRIMAACGYCRASY